MRTRIIVALAVLPFMGTMVPASAVEEIEAEGVFIAEVDFPTISLTPVGANCLLEVKGQLIFEGTLEGVAKGTTRALIFAPCGDVAITPPGTFKDVFRSKLEFLGTVDGEPATADLSYRGITEVGGAIKALFHLSNGLKGVLKVDAIVAVGGSYDGSVRAD